MEEQKVNNSNNIDKKEHDFRNIVLTFLGVFVILAAVSGGTFAYYAFSASNNNTITGTAATTSLTLTVKKISPTTTGPLVPQLEAGLKTAVTSGCVDGNSNKVCQVYSITVTNGSTATVNVGASLSFQYGTGSAFSNLRWKTVSANPTSNTAATLGTTQAASTTGESNSIGTATLQSTNGAATWYIVVWINETVSYAQNSLDYGTFTGVVTVTDSSGKGLTSTFVG